MIDKIRLLAKSITRRTGMPLYLIIIFSLLLAILLIFDWFVSDPTRAAKIDRYILFSMAETSRFNYAKAAICNPLVFLNPNAKPLYMIIASMFVFILPFGLISIKMLNSLLAIGILGVTYKLVRKTGLDDFHASIALILTLTSPMFFLLSIAASTELLFCFFLLLAICSFYEKKYFNSALLISLLPLIRQEGVIYFAICSYFLIKAKNAKYLFVLPIPLAIWILLNRVLLSHSFVYPFFVFVDMPGPTPASSVMSLAELKSFLPLIFCHPLFFLFPIGLMFKVADKNYRPIVVSLILHSIFFIVAAIIQYLTIKHTSYYFRYIVPLVPLMAIMAATLFRKVKDNGLKISLIVLIFIISLGMLVAKINAFQQHPRIVSESLDEQEEKSIKEATVWLNDYMQKNGLRHIFYPGNLVTHKIIRRLSVYLSFGATMYPVKDFKEIYDPITFNALDKDFGDPAYRGVVLVLDPEKEAGLISGQRTSLLKKFPLVSIYLLE